MSKLTAAQTPRHPEDTAHCSGDEEADGEDNPKPLAHPSVSGALSPEKNANTTKPKAPKTSLEIIAIPQKLASLWIIHLFTWL